MPSHACGEGSFRGASAGKVDGTVTGLYPYGRYVMTSNNAWQSWLYPRDVRLASRHRKSGAEWFGVKLLDGENKD